MTQPWRMKKVLYGRRKAAQYWTELLADIMSQFALERSLSAPHLFRSQHEPEEQIESKYERPQLVPKVEMIYAGLLSKNYNMPALNSQLVTKLLCSEIQNGDCFMFLTQDVVKHNVLKAPPIKILQATVTEQLEIAYKTPSLMESSFKNGFARLILHVKQRPADKKWYIPKTPKPRKRCMYDFMNVNL